MDFLSKINPEAGYNSNSYSAATTLTANNDVVFLSSPSAGWTLTLPTPIAGKMLVLIRTDSTGFVINVTGNINGTVSATNTTWFPASTANRRVILVSNGSYWYPAVSGTYA